MFFSIIIPIYNAEKTLERCLNSVQIQTFQDFQVILVDDGSTDSSATLCHKYTSSDPRFMYFYQKNGGVSSARNTGMLHAQGCRITFLDCDDIYYPEYLQEFYELAQKYPNHDSIWCGYRCITSLDAPGDLLLFSSEDSVSIVPKTSILSLNEKLLLCIPWNKMYKRSIIQNTHLKMPPDLSLGEDLLFNLDYLHHCDNPEIIVLNKALYGYYCISSTSLDRKYRADLREIYDRLDTETLKYLNDWHAPSEQMELYYNCMFYRLERVLRNTFREECSLSTRKKYRYNRKILRSAKFQLALNRSSCFIHPLYRLSYRIGCYRLIRFLDKLVSLKHSLSD